LNADLICAWCLDRIARTETPTGDPLPGICPACLLKHFGLTLEDLRRGTIPQLTRQKQRSYHQPTLPLRPTKIG